MYEYKIKEIIKIIDGDTLDLIIDVGFNILTRQKIRLDGIDTPEINSTDQSIRKVAMEAKLFVENWLKDQKNLNIQTIKDDKYGRIVGKIFGNDKICLNNILIEQGYAWIYGKDEKILSILLERQSPKYKGGIL
jgi:micrococcal nuclease